MPIAMSARWLLKEPQLAWSKRPTEDVLASETPEASASSVA